MMKISKIVLSVVLLFSVPALVARCQSCAEKIALKQSIAEALAAALAEERKEEKAAEKCGCNKPRPQVQPVAVPRPSQQQSNVRPSNNPRPSKPNAPRPNTREADIEDIDALEVDNEYRCQCGEQGFECTNQNCMCGKILRAPISMNDSVASLLNNECCPEISMCSLVDQLHQINKKLKSQKHAARRCCSRLRNDIESSEDILTAQISDASAEVNNLVISQIDQSAECCSVVDIIETLVLSQIDQSADCCSVLEILIGDLDTTPVDIITNPASITDFVDTAELDILTWLKSIYELVANIYICTCLG